MENAKESKDIGELLIHLGINRTYVGYHYIVYGISRASGDPNLVTYILKGLYVEIASHFHTSTECVERNIRTAIHTIWSYGDRNLLNTVFGSVLKVRPCNGEFIRALLCYVENKDMVRK